MPASLIDLEFKPLIREQVSQELVSRIQDAVKGAEARNNMLADCFDQLEMRLQPTGKPPWPNACDLNDPLSAEAHLELLALLTQALRKSPWWQVDSYDPADDDKAKVQEGWLDNKVAEYGLRDNMYCVAYNALRDPAGILYVGWKQKIREQRKRMYVHADDPDGDEGVAIEGEERDASQQYRSVVRSQNTVESQGCDIRVVELADIYLYPSDATSIQRATGIAERMLLTIDELLDGVDDLGYDLAQVQKLIDAGPTHENDDAASHRQQKNSNNGIDGEQTAYEDGFYEVYMYTGKLPKLRHAGGSFELPKHYFRDDAMVMVCPAHNIIFQLELSPYPDRPYLPFYMLKRPNDFLGKGVCQLLMPLQEEATLTLQATVNGINLDMTPALIGPPDWNSKYKKWSVYPGAIIPEDTPNDLRPLEWGRKSPLGLELHSSLVQRGKGLVAARGYGEMQDKVRKSAEINNVLAATDAKFDLFLQIFQQGLEELAARIVSLHAHFLGDDGQEEFYADGALHTINAQTLRGKYRYTATATSSNITPEQKLQVAQGKQQIQLGYIKSLMDAPPQFHGILWHGARQLLLDMNERDPESWIGPEPQAMPPEVQALLAALTAQGVPPALIMQAMQQSGMQGGVPGAAPPPTPDMAMAARQALPQPTNAPQPNPAGMAA